MHLLFIYIFTNLTIHNDAYMYLYATPKRFSLESFFMCFLLHFISQTFVCPFNLSMMPYYLVKMHWNVFCVITFEHFFVVMLLYTRHYFTTVSYQQVAHTLQRKACKVALKSASICQMHDDYLFQAKMDVMLVLLLHHVFVPQCRQRFI